MPRFYFDVSEGPKFMPDEDGFDLDSLDAAEHKATRTLVQSGEIGCRVLMMSVSR